MLHLLRNIVIYFFQDLIIMNILLFTVLIFVPNAEMVSFNNNPGTTNLNENDDSGRTLWSISATCNPSTNVNLSTILHTVECEECEFSSNPYTGLFYMSGKTVYKSACSDTSCGNCPSCTTCSTSNGCMNGTATYNIEVRCYTTSYDSDDSGTSILTVSVERESALTISLAGQLTADNSMSVGTILATASKSSGEPIVQYTKPTAVANSYLIETANMFELNAANGQVYVATNPAIEYDYIYTMQVCIHSRRRDSCKTISIIFYGCFQTPNCNDQSDTTTFSDQFPIGETMFTMTYYQPSGHFSSISSTWQNLNFVIVSSTLKEASLHHTTGVITSTGNITVWPDYPYSTHTIVVRVSNPGHSCHYSATCTISMQIHFTNWPVSITNLPAQVTHHEDTDARTLKLNIITYDNNDPAHDNVTCEIVTNEEPTLLELVHDGNYEYNSWYIYKKTCQNVGCGYIDDNFLCATQIGCLNYDLDNEYTMTVKCSDAYGSEDTGTFTLRVIENQSPVFTNTPTTVVIEDAENLKTVFTIYYIDQEKESLEYNFTILPSTPSVFVFDDLGNYYNNPANITLDFLETERTLLNGFYLVSFCGRERRNIVCSNLKINITLKEPVKFNNPGIQILNENDNSGRTLWNISATCNQSTNTYTLSMGIQTLTGTKAHTVECEACKISSNPDSGLFYISEKAVYKSACTDTSCGNCPSCTTCSTSNGCMNGQVTYNVEVRCYTTSYDNDDSGTSTLTVSVIQETDLNISLADPLKADNSMNVGTVLATASTSSSQPIIEYTKPTSVANSYLIETANMFDLNTANGQVYVATNPAVEFDYTYTMRVCIHSRRRHSCKTITINFDGCFQIPNCNDQSDNTRFSDQFPVGGTLFTMTYDQPSAHFSSISTTWQNLNFVLDSTTLNEASLHLTKGILKTTGNITVWPDYPYSTHTMVVKVSNPGFSCSYTSTCTIIMRFSFTNWPINITSLPMTNGIPEDTDERTLVHNILVDDKNNPNHDNVTCEIVSNDDSTLLEFNHNGDYRYNSWSIYKKKCQNPSCGYIRDDFLCKTGIGCMNHDLESRYNISVQCFDAYGSNDSGSFMLYVAENHAPEFTNTPTSIIKEDVEDLDTLYSIYYIDQENEDLEYNFTVSPSTPSVFAFDTHGNYHNNPAKITLDLRGIQREMVNGTYLVSFCGSDRRNIVCSYLTINITLKDVKDEENSNTGNDSFPIIWIVIVIGLAFFGFFVTILLCIIVRRKSDQTKGIGTIRVNERTRHHTNNPNGNNMNNEYDMIDLDNHYEELQHDTTFQRTDGDVNDNAERGRESIDNDNIKRGSANSGYLDADGQEDMVTENVWGGEDVTNDYLQCGDNGIISDSTRTSGDYLHPIGGNIEIENNIEHN